MSDWKLPWHGHCRCGSTRFRISAAPLMTMACHCTGCQRLSASAYSLSMAVPADGFEVVQGEPAPGGLKGEHGQFFCPSCMSWMFTRPHGLEWLVNVRPTMLDDHHWVRPFIEVWTSEKLPWAETHAAHSYPTAPEEMEFAPLIEAFARSAARP